AGCDQQGGLHHADSLPRRDTDDASGTAQCDGKASAVDGRRRQYGEAGTRELLCLALKRAEGPLQPHRPAAGANQRLTERTTRMKKAGSQPPFLFCRKPSGSLRHRRQGAVCCDTNTGLPYFSRRATIPETEAWRGERMSKTCRRMTVGIAALAFAVATVAAEAKDKVKVGFIGPLTGGVSVNGPGGRNSADLAVRLRNADPKAKYEYELVVLDDECKPNVAVQVATKMAADKDVIAGATHYCSATAIATVDTYHKFGFPVIVWGAVLPDITYRNKYDEVHRVNGTMINQNDANAELISNLGYKTVAVIHDTTDYGKGHNEYFSKALAKIGKAHIVGTFGVTAEQQDFTGELTKIKALNPE